MKNPTKKSQNKIIEQYNKEIIEKYKYYPQCFDNTLSLDSFYKEIDVYKVYFELQCIHIDNLNKDCLSTILANLYKCYKRSHDNINFYTYYSRSKNDYTCYNHLPYKEFIETVDILIENEFILHDRQEKNSIFRSRIAFTPNMCAVFDKCKKTKINKRREYGITQRKKEKKKELAPYKENKKTKTAINEIYKFNGIVKSTDICVWFPIDNIQKHKMVDNIQMWAETKDFDYISEIVNSSTIDNLTSQSLSVLNKEYILSYIRYIILFSLKSLCKSIIINDLHSFLTVTENFLIFHLNVHDFVRKFIKPGSRNFSHGGRFYSNIQQLPRDTRKYLQFDGQQTIELDYKCLHPSLLYAKIGINYKDDAYLPGSLRDESKKTLLSLINDENSDNYSSGKIVKELRLKHKPIEKYFGNKDMGIQLQRIDSDIASRIINTFTELNKPIIPVHDSFIVKQEDEEFLRTHMITEYKKLVGYNPTIDKKF